MERIKFNSQEEFAKAMVDNDLMNSEGYTYTFNPNEYPIKPFRIILDEASRELKNCWKDWETDTFTIVKKSRFPDKALVWCWDDKFEVTCMFWDAENDCVFSYDGKRSGCEWDHYQLYTDTPPEHMEEMKSKLED